MSEDQRGKYLGVGEGLDNSWDGEDDESCSHVCEDSCYDEYDEWRCDHRHCFACGGCECPGYCDDYQTYNLRPAETGGDGETPEADQ